MPLHLIDPASSAKGRTMRLVAIPVSAGFPSPAADDLEDEIDPIAWIVRHPASTFWWRVEGDCLLDAGILDGDLIAVDRAGVGRNGRAVLAVVEGAVTAKILRREGNRIWLAPANSREDYPPIPFTEETEVWGVIAGVARRYELE